jgi:hypothetical protein
MAPPLTSFLLLGVVCTQETYKKPDPRPPRKVEAKPSVVESQDEEDDDEEDEEEDEEEEDANSKVEEEEDEEEDELSLDSDKEFDMPAFSTPSLSLSFL